MRIVIQRVSSASVQVDHQTVGAIQHGLLALVGVGHGDSEFESRWLADKTAELRIFPDDKGKMNHSVQDVDGSVLVVSQFTLLGDCRKGRRPAFTAAAEPTLANKLYEQYAERLSELGLEVQRGIFAADMKVSLTNDGPVTLILERVPS
ncbi:MAG: D-aminoacyl-tRNA deacylase [Rubripirellula sp.]|nr:D-aminoacyl-tRNA deacylase [Rubripirellula sp.]